MSAETPCLYCGTEEAISRRKALELLAYLHCGAPQDSACPDASVWTDGLADRVDEVLR